MPLRLTVAAKPGQKNPSIVLGDGCLVVAVRERAVEGRANAAIERAIAAWLGVAVEAVVIAGGARGRRKFVDIAGVDPAIVAQRVASLPSR